MLSPSPLAGGGDLLVGGGERISVYLPFWSQVFLLYLSRVDILLERLYLTFKGNIHIESVKSNLIM